MAFRFASGELHSSNAVAAPSLSTLAGLIPMTLCLLAALTPLVFAARLFEPYIGAKEMMVQAGTATAGLLWLFTARKNQWTLPLTPLWAPLILIAFIGIASMAWSSNAAISMAQARYLATYVLLFTVSLSVMRQADARSALATALVLAGSIEAVYVLAQYLVGDPIFAAGDLPGKWRTFGTLGNPNWSGEFLAVAALVCLGRLVELRDTNLHFARHATFLAFLVMLLALVATLARGAWLAFFIGLVAFALTKGYKELRTGLRTFVFPVSVAVIGVVIVVLLPLFANPAAIDHLLNVKSIRGRLLIWDATINMISDAPWLGHGLGTFGLKFPEYQAEVLSQPSMAAFIPNASFTTYAHNDYLQLWAELGVFGFAAFVALIWIVLKRGKTLARDPLVLGFWAAIISILVNAAVAFPFHLPTTLMLFVMFVAVVEAGAAKHTARLTISGRFKRPAVAISALLICGSAYWFSYDRILADAALWRAEALLETKQFSEASRHIQTAVNHAPTNLDGRIMLGLIQIERGQHAQGLSTLDAAQKLGFDERMFDLKATALNESGRQPVAIEEIEKLIRLRPDLQWPRYRLAALQAEAEASKEKLR